MRLLVNSARCATVAVSINHNTNTTMYTNPAECYVFNDGNSNNALATAAMLNGGYGGMNGMNSPFWALIILAFLRNGGLWGNGNDNSQLSQIQDTLNTNQGNQLIMSAIQGNATSIKELASLIGCNHNAVQTAINGVQSAICGVGNQVGMTSAQVINAINNGNMSLANTLQSCCCDIKTIVNNQGYENRLANLQQTNTIQNGFAQVGYASAEQTCAIKQNATDNTSRILAKLDQIEDSRKDREIASLTAQLASVNARAERQAELAPITQKLNDIMCKQPTTYTVPYQPFTAVPNCVAYQAFGLNPFVNGGNFG